MRKPIALCLLLGLMLPLAGCGGQGLLNAEATDSQQQALADPAAGNVPAAGDSLNRAKEYFRNRNFGLAERQFRSIVEKSPNKTEAWLGLAATHDQLGRFDLADKEYAQVLRKSGASFELLNNRGYSYMMRGDYTRARRDFLAAQKLDPESEFVRNNLRELSEKAAGRG